MLHHKGIRPFVCKLCTKTFVTESHLKKHMKNHPSQTQRFTERTRPGHECKDCGITFQSLGNYKVHRLSHNGVQIFQCKLCDKLCSRENGLKKHLKSHTKVRDLSCPICKREFKQTFNLKRHVQLHATNKIYSQGPILEAADSGKLDTILENPQLEESSTLHNQNVRQLEVVQSELEVPMEITSESLSMEETGSEYLNPPVTQFVSVNASPLVYTQPTYTFEVEHQAQEESLSSLKHESNDIVFEIQPTSATSILQNTDDLENKNAIYELHLVDTKDLNPTQIQFTSALTPFERLKHIPDNEIIYTTTTQMMTEQEHHHGQENVHIIYEDLHSGDSVPLQNDFMEPTYVTISPHDMQEIIIPASSSLNNVDNNDEYGDFTMKHEESSTEIPKINSSHKSHIRITSDTVKDSNTCYMCKRSFMSEIILKRHLLTHSESGQISLTCRDCGVKFTDSDQYREHVLAHSDKTLYFCDHCGKSFVRKSDIKSHLKTHSSYKAYTCGVCKKSFTHPSSLRNHMPLHTGQKSFLCTLCGKAFARSGDLRSHMNTHSESKNFQCKVCDKSFTLKSTLRSHQLTHTGEKPYVCLVCNKGFTQSSSLKVCKINKELF